MFAKLANAMFVGPGLTVNSMRIESHAGCSTGAGPVVAGQLSRVGLASLHRFPRSSRRGIRLDNPLRQLRPRHLHRYIHPPSTAASPCCSAVLPAGVPSDWAVRCCSAALVPAGPWLQCCSAPDCA